MITIYCKDIDKSANFYASLGFSPDSEDDNSSNFLVEEASIRLRFVPADLSANQLPTSNLVLELNVLSADFLPESEKKDIFGGVFNELTDPDGNIIVIKPIIPRDKKLIMLSDLPRSEWIGKGVFRPHVQNRDKPIWFSWDSGVVVSIFYFDKFDQFRVNIYAGTTSYSYSASNCWVIV